MKISKLMLAVAASSMTVAPAMAAPANPASSLSVVKSVRAASPSAKSEKLVGGFNGILFAGIAVAIAALLVLAVDDKDDNSDSN